MPKRITVTLSDAQLKLLDELEKGHHKGRKLSQAGQLRLAIAVSSWADATGAFDEIKHGGHREGSGRHKVD